MSHLGTRLYPPDSLLFTTRRLPFGLYMKTCIRSQQNEAMALLLIEKHTSVPAPLYIDDYKDGENTVLISTRIPGQTLENIFHRLSHAEREQLSQDLKEAIHQLRRIPNRSQYRFANTLGLALYDNRTGLFGPFRTLAEFNRHFIAEYGNAEFMRKFASIHSRPHRPFFSHADLCPSNIITSQGRLAGIVDWESAGFYPEYWEYIRGIEATNNLKTVLVNEDRNMVVGMEKILRDAFDEDYEDELRGEIIRKLRPSLVERIGAIARQYGAYSGLNVGGDDQS
ncbi:kinase-like domain-containing protein [Aspergillus heterothallicus]